MSVIPGSFGLSLASLESVHPHIQIIEEDNGAVPDAAMIQGKPLEWLSGTGQIKKEEDAHKAPRSSACFSYVP